MTLEERLVVERLAENARQSFDAIRDSSNEVMKANFRAKYFAYKTVLETLENLNKEDK